MFCWSATMIMSYWPCGKHLQPDWSTCSQQNAATQQEYDYLGH